MRANLSLLLPVALLLAAPAVAQPTAPTVIWEQEADALSVTYSADGDYVATAGRRRFNPYTYGRLDVFAAADGAEVAYRQSHTAAAILGRTNRLSLSPDGQTVVSANGGILCTAMFGCSMERAGLFTWTFPDLVPLVGRTDLTSASSASVAPDGQSVAVAYFYDNAGLIRVHNLGTLDVEQELDGHPSAANDVAYSPDGTLIASVGRDGKLRVRDAATGESLYIVHHGGLTTGGWPISVAFSPDGSRIATGGDGYHVRVKVWEATTGELAMDLDGLMEPGGQGAVRVTYTPNGQYLVGAMYQFPAGAGPWEGRIRFWDAETGEVMQEYADMGPPPYHGGVRSISFSAAENHRFAYVVGEIGVVKLAETDLVLRDGSLVSSEPQPEGLVAIDVYPNPASGTAWLRLQVPIQQVVRVDVFDVLGRRVARLHDGELSPGAQHRLALDARVLPAGSYLVRVTGESFTEARRVTLVE